VAGLGWPAEESAEPSDLGWPTIHPQTSLSTNPPSPVSRETGAAPQPDDTDVDTDDTDDTDEEVTAAGEPHARGGLRTGTPSGSAPQAYAETADARPSVADDVSRETTPTSHPEAGPPSDGLPDTATQGVEQARFGPTLAPPSGPATATEIAAASGTVDVDVTTPLATAAYQDLQSSGTSTPALPRPRQPRVMVIANQKGGVGKTTTAVNMAAGLAQHGLRVLIVDLDPQGNASTALGIDHSAGTLGVYEVMADGRPLKDVVRECPEVPNLFGVPATIDLAGAEIELVSLVARESRLRKALDAYLTSLQGSEDRFDYVFIDCPPSLGLLTINALVAGREMLIPIQCEYYALEGVTQLLRNVEMVRTHLNPDLQVSTIVLTMYDGRTRLAAGVAEEVRQHFGDVVLRTAIPRSVRISEAPSYGQTVLTYDPASTGALSYLEAARELAHHPPQQTPQQTEEP
jgi:chromosome partitioning protein